MVRAHSGPPNHFAGGSQDPRDWILRSGFKREDRFNGARSATYNLSALCRATDLANRPGQSGRQETEQLKAKKIALLRKQKANESAASVCTLKTEQCKSDESKATERSFSGNIERL